MKIFDKWLLQLLLVIDFYFSKRFNCEHSDMYELHYCVRSALKRYLLGEGDGLHWEWDSTAAFSKWLRPQYIL